jgi:hypothetical protein
MYEIKGKLGESIVIGDGWIEKLRSGQSVARVPASRYEGLDTRRYSQRRFIAFGRKSDQLNVTIDAGTFVSIQLPADREPEVAELEGQLERAKSEAA